MHLDVRTPAGVMFLVLGALLLIYGALGDPAVYQRSLGVNINLYWGAAMIAFGVTLLIWRRVSAPIAPEPVCDDGAQPTVNGPR